jgi:hypothetical protein
MGAMLFPYRLVLATKDRLGTAYGRHIKEKSQV